VKSRSNRKRVLVSASFGFIGRHFAVDYLKSNDHFVGALDVRNTRAPSEEEDTRNLLNR